ncbi:MAG: endolytic transglycosylase MltG [bacterium]
MAIKTNKFLNSKSGKFTITVLGIVLIAGLSFLIWYWSLVVRLKPVSIIFLPTKISIEPKTALSEIASELKAKGLIRNEGAFKFYMRWKGWDRKIWVGVYEFSPSQSTPQIAEAIAKHQITHNWVVIPEGYRYTQIAKRLAHHKICNEDEFLKLAVNPKIFSKEIKIPLPSNSVEGYLFPDTYRMTPGIGARAAMKMMLEQTEKVYMKMAPELNRTKRSFHEVLTIASMVEREARFEEDRPLIASVIFNRLKINMKLDIDATVQYMLGEGWKPVLFFSDLRVDSPYNTYLYKGLPPGPIANPGIKCIEATLKPTKTAYLYYVAMPDGHHIFSSSLQEHNRAIHDVRLMRKQENRNSGGPT